MADRISSLPDPILCHILSFLETKQAISKSTLSKRWKNLWLSVPSLDLGHIRVLNINSYLRFINFVYVVFLSRDPALPINRFRLNFDDNRYQLHADIITKWINFVVQRRVQYIDLSLQRYFLETPVSILTCNTLVVLKLCSSCVGERLSPVLLPSLKTLHFENIRLPKLRDFILFLNGCPILEDLFTFDLRVNSTESLTCHEWNTFCLTNFTRADIVLVSFRCFPLKAVHNVRSLRYDFNQVHAGNDVIPTFHNLTELQCVRASLRYNWKFVVQVLTHCPNLQKLGINEAEQDRGVWWPINPNQQNWVVPDVVPQCLSLHLTTCNFLSFSGLEGGLMLAKYILKNAKVLRTMTIRTVGQPQIETLLSSCTKASATCKLTVYDVPWK